MDTLNNCNGQTDDAGNLIGSNNPQYVLHTDCYTIDGQTVTIYWQGKEYVRVVQDGAQFDGAFVTDCPVIDTYAALSPCVGIAQSLPDHALPETGGDSTALIASLPIIIGLLAIGVTALVINHRRIKRLQNKE